MPEPRRGEPKIKGILRKEGVTYTRKSLVWFEDLIAPEPVELSVPLSYTDTVANDLEQENFRQVWREVSQKKLHHAACIIQDFARQFMLCWILTNDRRTELYEELDYIQERKRSDLEWLEWEKEDMHKQADLEVQAERENAPPEEQNQVKAHIATITTLQAEIRAVKADNQKIREDCRKMKKKNKQLGYDLKEKAPAVEMSRSRLENVKENHRQIKANHDLYPPNVQKWIESIEKIDAQVKHCQWQGNLFRDCVLKVVAEIQTKYPRKRVLNPIKEILREDFAPYHPMPEIDMDAAREASKVRRRKSHAVSPKRDDPTTSMSQSLNPVSLRRASSVETGKAAALQDRMEMSERVSRTGSRWMGGFDGMDMSESMTERGRDVSESSIPEEGCNEDGPLDGEQSKMETVHEEAKEELAVHDKIVEAVKKENEESKPSQEPAPEPAREPVVEKSSDPVKEKAPEPAEEKSPEPVEEKAPEPVTEKAPEPVEEKAFEPVEEKVDVKPADQDSAEPAPEAEEHKPIEEAKPSNEVKPSEDGEETTQTTEDPSPSEESSEPVEDKEAVPKNDASEPTAEKTESEASTPEEVVETKGDDKAVSPDAEKSKKEHKKSSKKSSKRDSIAKESKKSSKKKKSKKHHKDKEKEKKEEEEMEAVDEFGGDGTETEVEGDDHVLTEEITPHEVPPCMPEPETVDQSLPEPEKVESSVPEPEKVES